MFPFGGTTMNNPVVKTSSAGAWWKTSVLLDLDLDSVQERRDIKCQVLINIFSCKLKKAD